jgi:hypothetical protein
VILINLCGGPGCGKTTLSYYLAYRLKKVGVRAELVGEAARERIYAAPPGQVSPPLLDNQVLLTGEQFERTLRLQRHGFEVAISDSPLEQGMLYCPRHPYSGNLKAVIGDISKQFKTYNILVRADPGTYDPESRAQRTEAEARALGRKARKLFKGFWAEVGWGDEEKLGDAVVRLALSKRTPTFELVSSPMIAVKDIKERRFASVSKRKKQKPRI